ncbi:YcdB/YcdC domain-containing protein [Clostridium sp. C2-6-12]|uniref:YcdB/YcdC domain-containing protein n=1 Tax=Clostridium sp. C2-6-12 TaxID=2698832 RepID=UPI0013680CBA|nr:YcdB/YcdC domain-containing protein [Clostridium sp. C2-6-12]
MKFKRASIIGGMTLGGLLIIISVILYNFIGPGAKEIKASKDFMTKLYSINAVNTDQKLDAIKYERIKTINSQNELVYRSISTQNFGIDLDKNNNVIGFAKKDNQLNIIKVKVEDAKKNAEDYLKSIYNGDVVLKSVNMNEGAKYLPYYSFIFTKQKDGYPFYFDEIKLNINKENGFLDGYSNSTLQKECKQPVINIAKEEAKEIALNAFKKYNKEGANNDKIDLVYADNKMEKEVSQIYELCYIVNVNGKSDKDVNISWKIFVSAESGKILNILKDGAEKDVKTN